MIEPIVLTEHGETLRGYPDSRGGDEGELYTCIGVHDVCNCWMDIRRASWTHNALLCRGCGLRVVIPMDVKTYGDLRQHLLQLQPTISMVA